MKTPNVITWYARIMSVAIAVVLGILFVNLPANADFETKNEFVQTFVWAAVVIGGMLYIGERQTK